ncbi:MAG TPA: hypothetical protein VIR58_13755 [Acidimicrobiales bacterium]
MGAISSAAQIGSTPHVLLEAVSGDVGVIGHDVADQLTKDLVAPADLDGIKGGERKQEITQ